MMKQTHSQPCVVVGIDGSESAKHAAEWAVEEAADRDIPLRLIHVIQSTSADVHRETDAGEAALEAAHAAVSLTGQPVKIETAILRGPVVATLVAESADAQLVCVGSEGNGLRLEKLRGAIAADVAESARCAVAVIHSREDTPRSESDDIAAILEDPSDLGTVLPAALAEARLRNATLLVLMVAGLQIDEVAPSEAGRSLTDWLSRYSDVQTRTLTVPGDVLTFLAEHDPPVQLAVMRGAGSDDAARVLGPYGRFELRDTHCSILVVRP